MPAKAVSMVVGAMSQPSEIDLKEIRIGIVTTWFERGAAYVSKAYVKGLENRFPVFVYARGGEEYGMGDPRWDKEYVTWGKRVRYGAPNAIDWQDFSSWVRENRVTHLIFNEQWTWDVILRSRHSLKVCIGAYIDYYTPSTVKFFRYYDFLLCNTERHYSVFRSHPQAIFVPWGTDLTMYAPQPESARKDDAVVFFHSCGLSPFRKGTDILVKSFRNVSGDAKLIIHSQGPLRLNSVVHDLILQDRRIELIEKTQGAPGYYSRGDVYVYPARLDGLGLTVPEALASGLPVVTTNVAPMNEFVKDNVNGKLVDVESVHRRSDGYYWPLTVCSEAKLTEAMQWYIQNRSLLPDLKRKARKHAESVLDWNKNAGELARHIVLLRRLEIPPRLSSIVGMMLYHVEISWRHWLEPLKIILHRLGAGWIKRKWRYLLRKYAPN